MDDAEKVKPPRKDHDETGCSYSRACAPSSAIHRYTVLFFLCIYGVGDYFCLDNPAALESNILHDLHLSEKEYMWFYSWVYWPGAVSGLVGGYLIDRVFGARLGIAVFSGLLALGQGLFATGAFLNLYWMMCMGRMLFSLAENPFGLSGQKLTVKWFPASELTMVFGVKVSIMRAASVANLNVMQPIYRWFSQYFHGYECLGMAFYVGVVVCVVSFMSGLLVCYFDIRADRIIETTKSDKSGAVHLKDIKEFPLTFWLTALTTTAYYLAVFLFVSLGPVFFERKYDKDPQVAATINSLPYFVSISMPLYGVIIDKTGRNLIWLFASIILTMGAHTLLTFTFVNPYIPVGSYWADQRNIHNEIILGVGYTIFTATVWPFVAYVVDEKYLGTAFGIMNALISVGQGGFAILTGYLADKYGYLVLQVFFMASVCGSLFLCILLYFSDSLRGSLLMLSGKERAQQSNKDLTLIIEEKTPMKEKDK